MLAKHRLELPGNQLPIVVHELTRMLTPRCFVDLDPFISHVSIMLVDTNQSDKTLDVHINIFERWILEPEERSTVTTHIGFKEAVLSAKLLLGCETYPGDVVKATISVSEW